MKFESNDYLGKGITAKQQSAISDANKENRIAGLMFSSSPGRAITIQ